MKKYFALICVFFVLVFVSCSNRTLPTEAIGENTIQTVEKGQSTTFPENNSMIDTVEKLTNVDGVLSVTEQAVSSKIKGVVAYKILYESKNGKLSADVVLPVDYENEKSGYSVLVYYPQIATTIDSLASSYALNGVIVVRPYARGYGESEGVRDLGGEKDLFDSKRLLDIISSANFVKNSKIFVAGSSEGSVTALRLFAEDKRVSGCAVIDVISDLKEYSDFRGDGIKKLFSALIGKTYEEAPEEYDLRSAVKFSEKLDRPLLIMHYTQSPIMSVEQTDSIYGLTKDTNKDCFYHKIDALSADFLGESLQRLLSWMNKYE